MTDKEKTDINFPELFKEFPELVEVETIYEKEVLAHFGLLFSKYAVLERGLQLCFVSLSLKAKFLTGAIGSKEEWINTLDQLDDRAMSATFGSLLRMIEDFEAFIDHREELERLKEKRNYFAHHFFREEVSNMLANDSMLYLMERMRLLRTQVNQVSQEVDKIHMALMQDLYPHMEIEAHLSQLSASLKHDALQDPDMQVGWEDT